MTKGKLHQSELTTKTPEASFFVHEKGAEANEVQPAFIAYLARRLYLYCKQQRVLPEKTYEQCVFLVVDSIGAKFREWFNGLADMETITDFVDAYGPPEGAERIFAELCPKQKVEDFLQSCLNGDEAGSSSIRCTDVHEKAMNTIIK
jgi:hypothetical protein